MRFSERMAKRNWPHSIQTFFPYIDKRRARAHVASLGLESSLPEEYWCGLEPSGLLGRDVVPTRFVAKLTHPRATACVCVWMMNEFREMHRDRRMTREQLVAAIERALELCHGSWIVAQELVTREDGTQVIPPDYRFYAFAGHIEYVMVRTRPGKQCAWVNTEFERLPHMCTNLAGLATNDYAMRRPRCWSQLVELARTIAASFTSFMRIDLLASPRGPVFLEFGATPGTHMTPEGDVALGRVWDEHCGDQL